jgi:hypothetical protein
VSINDESGYTTRCLLLASPDEPRIVSQQGLDDHLTRAFAEQLVLAIDVGKDTISVVDLKTKAVITSVGVAQVAATPETYSPVDSSGEGVSRIYTQPQLLLEIAGKLKLRIAILPMRYSGWNGRHFRYAWRGKARARDGSLAALAPTHVVTDAEWFSLLEVFGLASLAVDESASGRLDRRERFSKVYVIAGLTLLFIASIAFFVWYAWAISTGQSHHH